MAYKDIPDYQYAKVRSNYTSPDIEGIRTLAQTADKTYQEKKGNYDLLEIGLQNEILLDKDNPVKQEALAKLRGTMQSVIDRGDWETAGALVSKAAKDYATDKKLTAAKQSYANRNAQIKTLTERLTAKESSNRITKEQFDKSIKMLDDTYQGVKINPSTGEAEGLYGTYTPPSYVNEMDVLKPHLDKWASNKIGRAGTTVNFVDQTGRVVPFGSPDGKWVVKDHTNRVVETVDPREVQNAAMTILKGDQQYQDYQNSLDLLDTHQFRQDYKANPLQVDPVSGSAMEYVGKKDYDTFREEMRNRSSQSGRPIPSEEDIAIGYKNWNRRENAMRSAAGVYGDQLGFTSDVSTSTRDIDPNAFSLKKTETQQPSIRTDIIVPGLNSEFKTAGDFSSKQMAIKQNNDSELLNAANYLKSAGLGSHYLGMLQAAAKGDYSNVNFHGAYDAKGVRHDNTLNKFLLQIKQNNLVADQTEEYRQKLMEQAGIDPSIDMSYEGLQKELGINFNKEVARWVSGKLGLPASAAVVAETLAGKNTATKKEELIKLINEGAAEIYINSTGKGAKFEELVKENAIKGTQTIGLVNFSDSKFEDVLANNISVDLNENGATGAKWLGGENAEQELNAEDYKKISDVNPKTIRFGLKDGKVILAFRPYDKEKSQLDYVEMEAPQGVVEQLVQDGQTEYADVVIGSELDKISNSPSHTGNILGLPVTVPFYSDKQQSAGGKTGYTIVVPTNRAPGGEELHLTNSSDLINVIKNYVAFKNNNK